MPTPSFRLEGLTAATHTPFRTDGSLDLDAIDPQADHLVRNRVNTAFIGGTTGEFASLTFEERTRLTERWMDVSRSRPIRVVVHVGSNCISDAARLAAHAERMGAAGVSALSPSYFKPASIEALVDSCAVVAAAAPSLPFYYYDIPPMTGVHLPMAEFLESAASKIPNLAGLKFSNPDLVAYQECLRAARGRFDCPWGSDEAYLAALALGAIGGVGSTYNFSAPVHHRLAAAFQAGDLDAARREQFRCVQLVRCLSRFGYMAAARHLMKRLGLDLGNPRLPHRPLSREAEARLDRELEELGLFTWLTLP